VPYYDIDSEKLRSAYSMELDMAVKRDSLLRLVFGPSALGIAAGVTVAAWLAVHAVLWLISPALAIGLGIILTPLFILAGIAIPASQPYR